MDHTHYAIMSSSRVVSRKIATAEVVLMGLSSGILPVLSAMQIECKTFQRAVKISPI